MSETVLVATIVNGTPLERWVLPHLTLAEFLRDELGLTGTKVSCELQVCGVCTVLVDGNPVSSCTTLAADADGKTVLTIEGLATDGDLHPVQQAFIDEFAVQWGYAPIPNANSPEDELPTLNEWAREQDSIPWFRFTTSGAPAESTPRGTRAASDSLLTNEVRQLAPTLESKLLVDVRQMGTSRVGRDVERLGDRLVGQALRDEHGDLELAARQAVLTTIGHPDRWTSVEFLELNPGLPKLFFRTHAPVDVVNVPELRERSFTVSDVGQPSGELPTDASGVGDHGDRLECLCGAAQKLDPAFEVTLVPGLQGVEPVRPGTSEFVPGALGELVHPVPDGAGALDIVQSEVRFGDDR